MSDEKPREFWAYEYEEIGQLSLFNEPLESAVLGPHGLRYRNPREHSIWFPYKEYHLVEASALLAAQEKIRRLEGALEMIAKTKYEANPWTVVETEGAKIARKALGGGNEL